MESQKTVLIIEDEEPLCRALGEKLSREGFDISHAHDGVAGLSEALHKHPDLILLDIAMPAMDGIEMLQKLRKDNWGATAKVVVLTNIDTVEKVGEVLKTNTHDYLIKSDWKLEDIVKHINQKLASGGDTDPSETS